MKFTPAKPALHGETFATLSAALAAAGQPAFRARQVLDWLYKKRVRTWDEMTNLPRELRAWLDTTYDLEPTSFVLDRQSGDETDKLLLELRDKSLIET
ncbi:MAG: 23S rRNA (adenine(2503)-C(2))-methyltransferase RlmN, partial [Opitutus sp.]|nr:23S rRNA (adenine(2503)-C(2))-methyltransferase RlmN [Opitutus sp.]